MSRSKTITLLAGLYEAFADRKTWQQAELARRTGASVERLRAALDALEAWGWPLEREEEPPHVYWSVPNTWGGGGFTLPEDRIPDLLRLLAYLPDSPRRARVLALFDGMNALSPQEVLRAVHEREGLDAQAEAFLEQIEQGIHDERSVEIEYYSRHRGELEWREVSPQRVVVEGPHRFVALCHRSGQPKWFRLDQVRGCRAPLEPSWTGMSPEAIDDFISSSISGFIGEEPSREHAFTVPNPAARWVKGILPAPMQHRPVAEGIRVEVETRSVKQVARFVLTLAGAARDLTPELEEEVRKSAQAVLEALER